MGGSSKQTSTTTSEPWAPAQGALKTILSDSENLYKSGVGPTPFGSMLADQSSATTDALNKAEVDARAGTSPLVQSGLDWAQGQFGTNGINPYVEQVSANAQSDAANSIAGKMSAAGRYGSGAMQGLIADKVGRIGAETRMNAFESQQARNQSLLGQMPMLEQLRQDPNNRLSEIGGIRDARAQMALEDKAAQAEEKWSAPWQRIGLLAQTAVPIAGLGGTQTSVTQGPKMSPFQQILGGGMGILGGLGGIDKLFGAGTVKSGLSSLALPFALSDERAKEDISEPIAYTKEGIPIRSYRYKDGGPPHIGMLAQEVAEKKPDAVAKHPSGFLMVNYKKAVG